MKVYSSTFGNGYACTFGELRAVSFRQACRNGLAQVRGYGKYKRTETPHFVEYTFKCGRSLIVYKGKGENNGQ